jgi:hypothetical protein
VFLQSGAVALLGVGLSVVVERGLTMQLNLLTNCGPAYHSRNDDVLHIRHYRFDRIAMYNRIGRTRQ